MTFVTYEHQYLRLLLELLNAPERIDRTGTGTRSAFGRKLTIDLGAGFPLLTTKRLHTRSIVGELAWMLRGETNVAWLRERGVSIWNEWADDAGELGPVYGKQWRAFGAFAEIDQIRSVLRSLRDDPYSRRHIVSAWNPEDLADMALPPCHVLFQFYVEADGSLSCQIYQRSADVFLGLPFNVASYALLTGIFAFAVGRMPGRLHHVIGDAHLYLNHEEQAREQLTREPRDLPRLALDMGIDPLAFDIDQVTFEGYRPHPAISAQVAV